MRVGNPPTTLGIAPAKYAAKYGVEARTGDLLAALEESGDLAGSEQDQRLGASWKRKCG